MAQVFGFCESFSQPSTMRWGDLNAAFPPLGGSRAGKMAN
jgi:hypothetical protein